MLGVLVESLAGRLGGVADAVLRPELLRGATQARRESAHGSPAHLTIEVLPVDTRLRLAEDDHALHRHGLLITRACCVRETCATNNRGYEYRALRHAWDRASHYARACMYIRLYFSSWP